MITCVIPPPLTSTMLRVGLGCGAGSCLLDIFFPRQIAVFPLMYWVAEVFLSPPCPRPFVPGTPLSLRIPLEVPLPQANSSSPGLLVPLGDSTAPTTPWRPPTRFSATPEASGPPSLSPTPEDLPSGFPLRLANLSLFLVLTHGGSLLLLRLRP